MAWWSDWYTNATGAVGASMTAAQDTVSSLFRDPPTGSGAYFPDDAPVTDAVAARATSSPDDLFPAGPGPLPLTTDIQQSILTRPKTWDEMSWWEKAKTYVGIAPGAVADTFGLSGREGSSTPVSGPSGGVETIGGAISDTAESVGSGVGRVVSSTVSKTLGLPEGGIGGFLSSTLVKVIVGLVVVVVGLYFLARITGR
jgi:hypothetical protein